MAGGKPAGYLQAWSRIWTRDNREQIQLAVKAGLELAASELQVQRSDHSATLPPITQPWTIVRNNLAQTLGAIKTIRIRKIATKFKWTWIHFVTQVFTTGCCMS